MIATTLDCLISRLTGLHQAQLQGLELINVALDSEEMELTIRALEGLRSEVDDGK